tara:strand:- start:413 stop:1516 length:1104 start_codon:yes stop_codon:yes gene_type:complete
MLVGGSTLEPIPPTALYTWGKGVDGQLGQGSITNCSSPVQVGALTTWLEIAGGDYSSAGITTGGALYTWGRNSQGILGTDSGYSDHTSSPVQVGALTNWAKIEMSALVVALKTDGTLWGWGDNANGGLGLNNRTIKSSPVQVGADTDWAQVVAHRASKSAMAIKTSGALWGIGGSGIALGLGNSTKRSSPVQVGTLTNWAFISQGYFGSTAIKTDGTLWTWGVGPGGINGQNNAIGYSSPVQIGALTDWSTTARGRLQASAITTSGQLYMWGYNSNGQLGQNTPIASNVSSPVQVGALTDWSELTTDSNSVTALKTDGTLWSWGDNADGELGLNDIISRSSPVQTGSGTNWNKVNTGANFIIAIENT